MIKNIDGLLFHLFDQIRKQCDVAIIGLSGGADSTLVAILCTLALGKENVVGVHMPYSSVDSSGTKFNARSIRFARKLGVQEHYIPINKIADEICFAVDPGSDHYKSRIWHGALSQLDKGNARSRARMCVLYGLSGQLAHEEFPGKRLRVVGTGNLSEDFIGYDTKGGDALADFHPIGRLYKSEVYQLLSHFVSIGMIDEEHVDRVPSAGLWDGQTSEGELGHSYNEMEPAVRAVITADRGAMYTKHPECGSKEANDMVDFVVKRHLGNSHKHAAIPSFEVEEYVD